MKNITKPKVTIIGSGKPVIGIVGAMHGNESGPTIIQKLKKTISLKKGTIKFIIAHPEAKKKKVRFIDEDLNRAFPGNKKENREQQIAQILLELGKDIDILIDLHSCSMESAPFCIVRSFDGPDMQLAKKSGLPFIVVYPQTTQGGGSFIDYVPCGIGFELGLHDKEETIQAGHGAIMNILRHLEVIEGAVREIKQKILKIAGHLERTKDIEMLESLVNFSFIKKGTVIGKKKGKPLYATKDFYPVLYKEKSYVNTYGWIGEEVK